MRLYYFQAEQGNFGDDLNPWLWSKLLPGAFDDHADDIFVGVGTLLNHRIPKAKRTLVFGSGHGYGQLPAIDSSWHFYAVRGPLTATSLGLDLNLAITDPAALIPTLYALNTSKRYNISFMPHCDSARLGDWAKVCQIANIHYIDPRSEYIQVFNDIQQTELLLTEAMHGAILADAYRVPWVSIKAYEHICDFKWQDWQMSVQIDTTFSAVPPIWSAEKELAASSKFKNKLKHLLLKTPWWQKHWSAPTNMDSSEKDYMLSAAALLKITRHVRPNLSKQSVLDDNCGKLFDKLTLFKQQRQC